MSLKMTISVKIDAHGLFSDPSSIHSLINEVQLIQQQTYEIIKSTKRTMVAIYLSNPF